MDWMGLNYWRSKAAASSEVDFHYFLFFFCFFFWFYFGWLWFGFSDFLRFPLNASGTLLSFRF